MANTRNSVKLIGYFPKSEKIKITYNQGQEGGKKSYMFGKISVRRSFKTENEDGTKSYHYDLIPFKAFGQRADYINNFVKRGDIIALDGELQMGENRTGTDGNVVYGQLEFMVDEVSTISSASFDEGANAGAGRAAAPSTRAAAPAAPASTGRRAGFGVFGAKKTHNVL